VAPLVPAVRVRRRRAGRPRRGSWGLGTGLGVFRAVWRTRPWVSCRRRGTRGRRPRWSGLTVALDCSGEQSREILSGNDQIKGTCRLLTSSRSAGVVKQRRRRRGSTGRWWRTPAARENASMSTDRTQQGGRGHIEGRTEQLIVR
jgi:hypothetical protein